MLSLVVAVACNEHCEADDEDDEGHNEVLGVALAVVPGCRPGGGVIQKVPPRHLGRNSLDT